MGYIESVEDVAKNLNNLDFIIEITKNKKSFTGVAEYGDWDIHPRLGKKLRLHEITDWDF